jgi:Universal stress protein family
MAFTHILLPTDFSEPANRALHYALEEASLHNANVTLLHVLPAHTGTDVYFITGRPDAQPDFEPAFGRRLGTPAPRQPTVVLHDHNEAALTQLRDLMPASFQGSWEVDVAAGPRRRRLCTLPTSVALTSLSWEPTDGLGCNICSWAVWPKRWCVWHHAQY